ncbi:MAG TPA: PH domain-containing protein [Thermoanaerobaculia bacterium]|nr:PH domain-containing protein [Thermoanaerobaculia bacterium]
MERPDGEVLQELLGPDEKLLWTGRPRQGFFLRSADGFAIPFSLFWTGFAVLWVVLAGKSSNVLWIVGVPLLLIGVYMMVGRFFLDAWQRARTWYGLTNQRVLIVSLFARRNVKSLNLRALSAVTLSERGDGVGSITFGPVPPSWPYRGAHLPGMSPQPPRFDNIPQAREVFDQIRRLQA